MALAAAVLLSCSVLSGTDARQLDHRLVTPSVTDVETLYGPVAEIVKSEIESREFITFERQPDWLTLRLDDTGDFTSHPSRTTRFRPGAKISALQISSH